MWKKWSKRTLLLLLVVMGIISGRTTGYAKTVTIDSQTFPDPIVREAVKDAAGGSTVIDTSDIKELVLEPYDSYTTIKNLKGLELFTKLEKLSIGEDGSIDEAVYINSSKNEQILNTLSKLKTLEFNSCKIKKAKLKLSLRNLQQISLSDSSKLTAIDLSSCTKLREINGFGNKNLKKLTLPKSGSLKNLYLTKYTALTAIPNLNLQKNIETLYLEGVKITSLNADKFTKLKELRCEDTKIKTLNLSHSQKLAYVSVNPSVTKRIIYASSVGKDFYLNLVNHKAKNLTLKNYMPSGYSYAGIKENAMQPKKSINPGSNLIYNSRTTHVTVKKDYEDALLLFKKGNSVFKAAFGGLQ